MPTPKHTRKGVVRKHVKRTRYVPGKGRARTIKSGRQ